MFLKNIVEFLWLSCCMLRVYLIIVSWLFFEFNLLGIEVIMILSVWGNKHESLLALEIISEKKVKFLVRSVLGRHTFHSPTKQSLSVGPLYVGPWGGTQTKAQKHGI